MRSSIGNVPLEFMEASISSNSFINNIPINGVFALKNAIEEKKKGQIDVSENSYLNRFNYKNTHEVIADYSKYFLNQETPVTSDLNIDSIIFDKIPINKSIEENPVNIVFIQMESLSTYFFKLHSERFNMLGALEEELPECVVFQNFTSSRDLTIYSMDGLIVNSQLSPLSQSKYLNVSIPSSIALPFLESGYATEFVTGGRLNWRNLEQFLPRQGFQKLEGGADLKKHCPSAYEEHEWGVYDEFMMERIVQKLKEKREKPLFIYGVTITNHTPYNAPKDYEAYPIEFDEDIKALLNSTDEKTKQILICYQYMCNSLGKLIHEIRNSELGENTIIIATGDHSSHIADNLFGFSEKDFMNWHGVPLIFYIPEHIKNKLYIDPTRFGSHKDIFPTIYQMALSDAHYYNSGNNLFSSDTTINYFGLFDYNTAINNYGCTKYNNFGFTYFNWTDKKGGEITNTKSPSPKLTELGATSKAYTAFHRLETIRLITNKRNIINNISSK